MGTKTTPHDQGNLDEVGVDLARFPGANRKKKERKKGDVDFDSWDSLIVLRKCDCNY